MRLLSSAFEAPTMGVAACPQAQSSHARAGVKLDGEDAGRGAIVGPEVYQHGS